MKELRTLIQLKRLNNLSMRSAGPRVVGVSVRHGTMEGVCGCRRALGA